MMNVIRHPGLKQAMAVIATSATAVDEALVHATHFGDMGMNGDESAIGQNETNERLGALEQAGLKIAKSHG